MKKAFVLYSGGLDSILAVKLLQDQGLKVIGVHFTSPFFGKPDFCRKVAKDMGFELKIIKLNRDYFKILRNPRFGYGRALNPCKDCHIFMFKKIKKIAGDNIIASGEVLGQRPFSQKLSDFRLIEKEAGLEGRILRPLSAKLLPPTIWEKDRLVKREMFLAIKGRGRRIQIDLAKKYKLPYLSPAGGCLLCEQEFSRKLKDLFEHKKIVKERDLELLKIGRHFRIDNEKIIVGRNEEENKKLEKLKGKGLIFKVEGTGPTTLLEGKSKKAIEWAAKLTLFYSDEEDAVIRYGKKLENKIKVSKPSQEELKRLRI